MTRVAPKIEPELGRELERATAESGCRLLEAAFHGNVLRLVLDRDEGVTVEDCAAVSRRVSAVLDVMDFGSARYVLEVSSPGLDRKLYGADDYHRFTGRQVRVTFRHLDDGRKETVVGRLQSLAGDELLVSDEESGRTHAIGLAAVEVARLVPEL